jgi:hypothetical protein
MLWFAGVLVDLTAPSGSNQPYIVRRDKWSITVLTNDPLTEVKRFAKS